MGSLTLKQIKTLIYRNYLLTIRKKGQTAQMVGWPIYFVVLLVILKVAVYKPTTFDPMPNDNTLDFVNRLTTVNPDISTIFIAPEISGVDNFMAKLRSHPFISNTTNIQVLADQTTMDNAYRLNPLSSVVGILFSGSLYDYSLRFGYTSVPGSGGVDGLLTNCRTPDFFGAGCPANNYLISGFSALQAIIDEILIEDFNTNYEFPNITLQKMPRDTAIFNTEAFTIISAIYLVFAFSPFMLILLVNVVAEKQRKIKEAMKVMGLGNFALWFSWSLTYGGILFFMTIIMSIIAKFGTLFEHSDFFVIFLLFFLYGVAIEMMGFMLTAFFVNARTAGTAGGFINVLLGLLYLIVAFVPNLPIGTIWALNLFAPTGFAIAVGEVALSEVTGGGTNFSNLWSGRYPVGITFIMLTVDIFLYFILILYFDKIIPGEYGQREPFYFFLKPSYWFPPKEEDQTPPLVSADYPKEDFEPISDDLQGMEAIRFSNISKIYKPMGLFSSDSTSTTAVNNFSLDIYEGQITALLGHNGAGKTTLFNILTGFVDSTSGHATVFNHNISNSGELEKVRRMTGFCPQHNILFDILSVREHLQIFAGIKGISNDVAATEVERIMKIIGLQDQADTFAKNLSGGQKRKLSVGIAIMGDPKILILDEPTAGMDPYSRHTLWNVLRERKGDRVTLLTTHFMDEADILADRKAIISRGKLRCVGSSLFLKSRFGIGYHLGVVTKAAGDHSALTDYVIGVIPGAELQRSSGYELGYTLPITTVGKFPELFNGFDSNGDKMDVQSYGVSMTTLEEVFLKIGEEDEAEVDENGETIGLQASNNEIVKRLRSQTSVNVKNSDAVAGDTNGAAGGTGADRTKFDPAVGEVGTPSPWSVFFALVKIQLLGTVRSPGFILFGFIIPLGLAIGGAAVLNIPSTAENTVDPPTIALTSGIAFSYPPLLYKNSTGGSIDDFVTFRPVPFEASNLTNLYATRGRASYIASDVNRFERNQINYRALYNVTGIHSIPAIFNIMSQTVLKHINSSAPSISVSSKRWPATTEIFGFNGGVFGGVLMSAFAVIMVTGIPIIIPVQERELKIRSQLRISGVNFGIYWSAHFFVTFVWYLIIVIGFIIGIVAFDVKALATPGALGALILNLIGCGMASIATSLCGSFMYDKFETASSTWFNIVQLATFLPYLIVSLLDQLAATSVALVLNVIFVLLIPYYSAFSALYYISKIFTDRVQAGLGGTVPPSSLYFDWSSPMVPFSILIPYLQFVGLLALLRILDARSNGGKISDAFGFRSKQAVDTMMMEECMDVANEDEDVKEERRRVGDLVAGNIRDSEPVIVMQNMRKEFAKRSSKGCFQRKKREEKIKVAVDNLSLSVHPGEVLGLLGPNGAGKTTAISVMTGDHGPTRGKVIVSGCDILSNESEAFQKMGYCSQDNPLWETITLKEHLEMYAIAHGVKKDSIEMTINNYVDALDIREHLNKRAKQLSGGTKRKLCFAMAMMGNPQVVLLDEPSTGMDPKTKRFMWDTISTAFERSNRGAVLTTHYMDEADALCSRVAIMVLGQLRCIGSTQHLKGKFGQGYMLEIKLKEHQENSEMLNHFVSELFENVPKPEQFSHRFVYKIAQKDVTSLARVFGSLEEKKEELGIEEYCFSQATLEQVFLQFAKEQDERESEESR